MTISPLQFNNDHVTNKELDEIKVSLDEKFFKVDRRFDEARIYTNDAFYGLENVINIQLAEVRQKFVEVDQRFNEVDKRFNEVDSRFDAVDKRFNKVDLRFDAVDKRFDILESKINNITKILTKK